MGRRVSNINVTSWEITIVHGVCLVVPLAILMWDPLHIFPLVRNFNGTVFLLPA